MGLFDLRCGISGLSTTFWPPYEGDKPLEVRSTCSMFLLEELDGALVPWTPPVSGTYDRYGGIELWPQDESDYTKWVGERLFSLISREALVSSWREDLAAANDVTGVLKHGAETVYNNVTLTIDERRVAACIVLDQVADAIAADDPAPVTSIAGAVAELFPAGGAGLDYFAKPPASALSQLRRYASVARYAARTRRGFKPITSDDARQQRDDDVRRYARSAWEQHEGPIRRYIEACKPDWVARWKKSTDQAESREQALKAPAKPYSIRTVFTKGDVIAHPTLGTGLVEDLVGADKIRVRFGKQDKILVHNKT
jgi:hypothetical protein